MDRAFAALQPALLVFSRSDLWPEMLMAARRHSVPVAVAGGAIGAHSLRLRGPARAFLRPLYGTIRYVGALTDADASRWRTLGVSPHAIAVTGDPRHDQVLERPARLVEIRRLAAWAAAGPTLVAGSVEPEDAVPLREAFREVLARRPEARLLVVPHDPSSSAAARFRDVPNCVVVDTMGALADLYLLGDLACVGGGHSTLEPAVYAIPLVPTQAGAAAIARQWLAWLDDPQSARAAGISARRALAAGASSRSVARLLPLVR
jgi:3-deoxy-D-manno-octulosonic-acid transferase